MFRILVLVCSFISVTSFAQISHTTYYDYVGKAEMALVELSKENAITYYDSAFTVHVPFTKDLMNAYHCALQLGNFKSAKTYLYALLQRGIKEQHISVVGNTDLPPHTNDSIKVWLSQFVRAEDPNPTLRAEMALLNKAAQNINVKLASDVFVRDSFIRIYEGIKENSDRLFELFSKYGVPGENVVGQLSNDPLLPVLYNNALKQYFKYIDKKEDRNGIDTLLIKAVLAGDYHPSEFVTLLGDSYYASKHVNFQFRKISLLPILSIKTIYVVSQATHYPEYLCNEETVNKQRQILGLDALSVFRQKIAFADEQVRSRTAYSIFQLHDRSDFALSRMSVYNKQAGYYEEAAAEIQKMEKCK